MECRYMFEAQTVSMLRQIDVLQTRPNRFCSLTRCRQSPVSERPRDTEPSHLVQERRALDVEYGRGAVRTADDPLRFPKRLQDVFTFSCCKRSHSSFCGRFGAIEFFDRHIEDRIRRENDGALDEILQFAYVAWP